MELDALIEERGGGIEARERQWVGALLTSCTADGLGDYSPSKANQDKPDSVGSPAEVTGQACWGSTAGPFR